MCLFRKKPKPPVVYSEKTVITYGKNVYPGQPLNGCVNDSNNLIKAISAKWPDVKFIQKLDDDCTAENFLSDIEREISVLPVGGTVALPSDSCFSESNTRLVDLSGGKYNRPRLFKQKYPPRRLARSSPLNSKESMKWVALSACGEHQTAADAYFKTYEGAFTHFAIKALEVGITYREWYRRIREYLPSNSFSQIPSLEGPDYLLDRILFDGPTLWIHNSSHGSYEYDKDGDEADGQDEGIYFDRLVIDDEINTRLQKIRV